MLKDNVRVCNRCERYDGVAYRLVWCVIGNTGETGLLREEPDLCSHCAILVQKTLKRAVAPRAKKAAAEAKTDA